MKSFIFNMLALILLVQGFGSGNAKAQVSIDAGKTCVVSKIDGDKVPFPLKEANTKFELAENETYILNGFIVTSGDKTFFKVDFDSQPWLATKTRVANPYLLIDPASVTILNRSENSGEVQISVYVQQVSSALVLKVLVPPVKNDGLHRTAE